MSNQDVVVVSLSVLLSLTYGSAAVSPTPRSTSFRALTACAAVTQSDVEEALGRKVGRGRESEKTCDFEGTSGIVTVAVHRLTEKLDVDGESAALQSALPRAKLRETPGLGSRSFFLDLPGVGTQLHVVQQGRVYLMVSVLGFGEANQVSVAAESIARRAMARLLPR